jgi:hypothetical protein
MNERPPQPPEGKLIADALEASGLSIREASRRANISYGRWRQITSGYQNVSPGSFASVRAPAGTLARMARVVGVTPERLASDGQRPDAAAVLSEILRSAAEPSPPPRLVAAVPGPPSPDEMPRPDDRIADPAVRADVHDRMMRLWISGHDAGTRRMLTRLWELDGYTAGERMDLIEAWVRYRPPGFSEGRETG